jgi:transposase InsO family protein
MRENSLNARCNRKHIPTTDSRHTMPVCENVLNRDFNAVKAGQKWVSDITRSGWLYLTVVLDLFDRKVIGWAFSDGIQAVLTAVPAVEMAVKNRTP